MRYKLMSSAMMPTHGTYSYKRLSKSDFFEKVSKAFSEDILDNHVSYPQNLAIIAKNTGISLEPSRAKTFVREGDSMLVMTLKYRVVNPSRKGQEVRESDFDYGIVQYEGEHHSKDDNPNLSDAQLQFLNNLRDGIKYSFDTDTTSVEKVPVNRRTWKDEIIVLNNLCKRELGTGYQSEIAKRVEMKPQGIQRMFALKYSPTFKNLYAVVRSIGYRIKFVKIKNSK